MNKAYVWIAVVMMTLASAAYSSIVPPMINYQGKLMLPSGAPIADSTYSMRFAIYDVPTGGTALWSEINPSVQVKGGLFAVMLGSVTNLPANIFDSPDRFFGVTVGTDTEMTPRQKIASVAYAQNAGNGVPVGGVIMWSGAATAIPTGWALCDGTNGTPNLRDRFIVGAGAEYAVGATGGEKTHQLTVAEMPSHSHTWSALRQLPIVDDGDFGSDLSKGDSGAFNTFSKTTDSKGGDQSHENRPPYYALCFIMKLGN